MAMRVSASYRVYELIHRKHCYAWAHGKPSIRVPAATIITVPKGTRMHPFAFILLPDDLLGRRESDRLGGKFCLCYLLVL